MMKKRRTMNPKELIKNGSEAFRALNEHKLTGLEDTKPKRSKQTTLVKDSQSKQGLVHIPGTLLVRIIRIVPYRQPLDDDNLEAGSKGLRDRIAAMLGRQGDSTEDGLHWQYREEIGPTETRIEIYKHKE